MRLVVIFILLLTGCGSSGYLASSHVVVEWTTATEIDTAGFNIYRSENREGPYSRINADLIPASPDPLVGGKYRYEDASVKPGQVYYYRLEDVERGGASTQHGPIVITAPTGTGFDVLFTLTSVAMGVLLCIFFLLKRRRMVK